MSRVKFISASLTIALVVAATISAAAHASPVWLVKGKVLESSLNTSLATVSFGKLTIKWEDATTKETFEAECKKASGEAELIGDEPGTDKLQAFKFKECSLVKAAEGCELTIGGVTSEELPGWSTTLETVGEKTYDVATGISFSLILEGCKKVSFSKTWLFRGALKAEMKNESGKIKVVFPTSAIEGDSLESEGAKALLSAEGKWEEKEGGTLETMKGEKVKCLAMPCYLSENGALVAGTLKIELKKAAGSGQAKLEGTLAGIGVLIECEEEHGAGTIENSATSDMGESAVEVHYKKCHVVRPEGQGCLVLNELINVASAHGLLLLQGTSFRDDFSPATPPTFTTISIDGCSNSNLNGKFKVNGTASALVNNAISSLEFSSTTGSNLTFGGNLATYTDTVQVLMEGGGKIDVEGGS
jgi:hypothetical protein